MSHAIRPETPDRLLVERLRALNVAGVVTDIDGTLTDGSLYCFSDGTVGRRFMTHDGMGHNLLHGVGLVIGWLSATTEGDSIRRRAQMLDVAHVDAGKGDKGPRFIKLCEQMGVDGERTVYIGDDVNDLPAMALAGFCACPADAVPHVRAQADHVLTSPGGHGAFRELADAIVASLG
jgi:3-deoxy-D-manno-octulosonate 8-phosphate phosphatase (KDO 8-P phosphatase)